MARRAYARVEHSVGAQYDSMPGGATIRIAIRGESTRGTGVRLSSGGTVGPCAESRRLRECWCWINGPETLMDGRQRFGESRARNCTRHLSSTKGIALMRGSGRFRIIRCGEYMHEMKCMRACGDGNRLNLGSRVSRK